MEITNNKSDGVEIIKKALLDVIKKDDTLYLNRKLKRIRAFQLPVN